MRIVVQTTEGVFRSDEIAEEDAKMYSLVNSLNPWSDSNHYCMPVHGFIMSFNPRHIVWVKIVENNEPF